LNKEVILLIIGILYLLSKLTKRLSDKPVIFSGIETDDKKEICIYIKLLYYRGYTRYGKGDGRLYIETRIDDKRKIIVRKHNFRNKKGLILYIPLYDKDSEDSIMERLKCLDFGGKIWKEKRMEVEGTEILGLDIGRDSLLGAKIIKECGVVVFSDIQRKNIVLYYKNVSDLDDTYDIKIEDTGEDEETKKKLDVAVRWSRKTGEIMGKIINPFG